MEFPFLLSETYFPYQEEPAKYFLLRDNLQLTQRCMETTGGTIAMSTSLTPLSCQAELT